MIENGPGNDTVATAAGMGAHTKVPFGNIEDLTQYRMAFVGRRGKDQGVVTEPDVEQGPRPAVGVRRLPLSSCRPTTSSSGSPKATSPSANVTFRLNPEPGQPEFEEHGYWLFEDAGTFTAAA